MTEATYERLPDERNAVTHKYHVGKEKEGEGYVTVGFYPDGRPGEVFVSLPYAPYSFQHMMEIVAASLSIGLQHGIPLKALVEKFRGMDDLGGPSGETANTEIQATNSILDYILTWMELRLEREEDKYGPQEDEA